MKNTGSSIEWGIQSAIKNSKKQINLLIEQYQTIKKPSTISQTYTQKIPVSNCQALEKSAKILQKFTQMIRCGCLRAQKKMATADISRLRSRCSSVAVLQCPSPRRSRSGKLRAPDGRERQGRGLGG